MDWQKAFYKDASTHKILLIKAEDVSLVICTGKIQKMKCTKHGKKPQSYCILSIHKIVAYFSYYLLKLLFFYEKDVGEGDPVKKLEKLKKKFWPFLAPQPGGP